MLVFIMSLGIIADKHKKYYRINILINDFIVNSAIGKNYKT
jgi:hypothetical protein